jgi:hypothetical protein
MKLINLYPLLAVIIILSVQSRCKRESDLCLNPSPFKADFTLGEIIGDSLVATDTLTFFRMTARAAEKYASIKWEIGNDARNFENKQEVNLDFNTPLIGQTFTVRMIAKGQPNTMCFPDDDGIDTVTKQFTRVCTTIQYSCLNKSGYKYIPPVFGVWRGATTDNPNHTFEVTLVDFGEYAQPGASVAGQGSRIFNLPEGCGGVWIRGNLNGCGGGPALPISMGREIGVGALAFSSDDASGSSCCPYNSKMFGRITDKARKEIIIYLTDSKKQTTIFKGKRVE